MRSSRRWAAIALASVLVTACSAEPADLEAPLADSDAGEGGVVVRTPVDASTPDAPLLPPDSGDAGRDAGAECYSSAGAPGSCVSVSACAALKDHVSIAGRCPGPADIQCCTKRPNPADNPPTPGGYKLMAQSRVTPEMTAWAVAILRDPVTYPMFATTTRTFGTLEVLARVEWHVPDFQNSAIHRGVTLYQPL